MKKVGALTWVDPDRVVAVDWDNYTSRMPRLWLDSGAKVLADDYATHVEASTEKQQVEVQRLLVDLGLDDAPRRRVEFTNYDADGNIIYRGPRRYRT